MGTRNLTMVISNGKTKVAQYGQWDGYLEGQGKTVYEFIKQADIKLFKEKVDKCKFISNKVIKNRYAKLGITGNFMNLDQAATFKKAYPQLDRDMAAEVLHSIYDGKTTELEDTSSFAADGLFCEYAYVIDLDKNTFEIYTGFHTEPLPESERFYYLQDLKKEYKPVKLLKSYPIDNLPTMEEFLSIDKEEEVED